MADKHGRTAVWRRRDFRLLWAGQSISEMGSQVSFLAIPLVAIDELHASAFSLGVLLSTQTLPFLLVSLPAGAWVDRLRRRPVLIVADVGRCLAVGSVPVAWALHVLTLTQLYVVGLVGGFLTVLFDVAYLSYLPMLVGSDQLVEGNAKLGATTAAAEAGGPAVGGLLVGILGAASAVAVDAASFVVSFGSILAIRTVDEARPGTGVENPSTVRSEIADGVRFVLREPHIRSIAAASAVANLFYTAGAAVFVVFLRRQLHLTAAHIGFLFAVGNIGGFIGAAMASRVAARVGVGPTIVGCLALSGAGQLAYPWARHGNANVFIIAGGIMTSMGSMAYNINQVSLRQALCPRRLQGRMNATVRFVVWGTMPVGALLGGLLGTTIGLRPALWVAAIGASTAFLWVLLSPVARVRTIPGG